MATKVYGIPGKTTVELKLQVDKATLPLSFEHGCLDRKNYKPATFSTRDKVVQDMIENSPMFGRIIKLIKVYGNDSPAAAPAKQKSAARVVVDDEPEEQGVVDPTKVFADVTTYDELIAVLKSKGAKATQIKDAEAAKKFIIRNGFAFPNFNFE